MFLCLVFVLAAPVSASRSAGPYYTEAASTTPPQIEKLILSGLRWLGSVFDFDKIFRADLKTGLETLTREVCREDSLQSCENIPFYPCRCARAFAKFDSGNRKCRQLPCTLLSTVTRHFDDMAERLTSVETFEDIIGVLRPMLDEMVKDGSLQSNPQVPWRCFVRGYAVQYQPTDPGPSIPLWLFHREFSFPKAGGTNVRLWGD